MMDDVARGSVPMGERLVRVETILERHEQDLVPLRPVPAALAVLQSEMHAIRMTLGDQATKAGQEFTLIRQLLAINTDITTQVTTTVQGMEDAAKTRSDAEVQARKVHDLRLSKFFSYLGGLMVSILGAVIISLYSRAGSVAASSILWIAVVLGIVCMAGLLFVSFRTPSLPTS